MTPAVSVVIVSFNTRDLLLECLASLAAVRVPLETIVVDNASTDGSASAVRTHAPSARVIESGENLGFSRANNLGFRAAQAPFVLVLNSDAAVRPGAVETLLETLRSRPDAGIVGPRTVSPDGAIQVSFGPDLTPWNEWRQRRLVRGVERRVPSWLRRAEDLASQARETAWVSGSCLVARRDLLERLGGFDEAFFLYEEDVDLCVRARAAGYKVLFTPRAEIVHHLGRSIAAASERAREAYRESHLHFYAKHNGPLWTALLRAWISLQALRAH